MNCVSTAARRCAEAQRKGPTATPDLERPARAERTASARGLSLYAVRVKSIEQSPSQSRQLVERLLLEPQHFRGRPYSGLARIRQRLHGLHVARIGGFVLVPELAKVLRRHFFLVLNHAVNGSL